MASLQTISGCLSASWPSFTVLDTQTLSSSTLCGKRSWKKVGQKKKWLQHETQVYIYWADSYMATLNSVVVRVSCGGRLGRQEEGSLLFFGSISGHFQKTLKIHLLVTLSPSTAYARPRPYRRIMIILIFDLVFFFVLFTLIVHCRAEWQCGYESSRSHASPESEADLPGEAVCRNASIFSTGYYFIFCQHRLSEVCLSEVNTC